MGIQWLVWSLFRCIPSLIFTGVVIANFFEAHHAAITDQTFHRISSACLNGAKSINPLARSGSIDIFKVIVQKNVTETDLEWAMNELCNLPKSGRTTGPDHRVALYSMLAFIPPSSSISAGFVQIGIPLLSKESHDVAAASLSTAIAPHITFLLRTDTPIAPE